MRRAPCVVFAAFAFHCQSPAPPPSVIAAERPPAKLAPSSARPTIAIDDAARDGRIVVELPDPHLAPGTATIEPLDATATAALTARMEPPPVLDAGHAPPLRAPTVAPPRGDTQPIAFVVTAGKPVADLPPGSAPPEPAPVKPLTPPEITPQGDVGHESEVRVRFDEAMVAVAQVGAAAAPPVTLAPAVRGTWRWLDTRVLEFAPTASRLPQATEFIVTVPAGTRALTGDVLAAPATQTFRTPPVALAAAFPQTPMRPDSAIAIALDQDVDPAQIATLLSIHQVVDGHPRPLAFHVVPVAEAQARWRRNPSLDPAVFDRWVTPTSRVVIVAPDTAWPSGARGVISLAAAAPSREGPRLSTLPSQEHFDVAPEMRVAGVSCNALPARPSGNACPAFGFFNVEMTNPIAAASYRAEDIQIAGEPFADNRPDGAAVLIETPRPVGRAYRIDVAGDIADVYGQPLVGPRQVAFTTGPEQYAPALVAPTGLLVLDPRFAIPQWTVAAESVTTLRIELYRVEPADYFAYEDFENNARATPPGTRVFDHTYEVGARHGIDARVDLRPALSAAGTGHVIAIATAEPARPIMPGYDGFPRHAVAWFQVTRLGVVGRVDGDRVNAWVRDISPAAFLAPIAGATASIVADDHAASAVATTDAEGHAALALLPPVAPRPTPVHAPTHETTTLLAIATKTDSAFVAMSGDGHAVVRERDALWYATDDRFTYKPGEPVYVKGWVRWTTTGVNPDLAFPAAGDTIAYALHDATGNELARGSAALTDQGGFDVTVALPGNANLGTATFTFSTHDDTYSLPIAIEEFRAPTYSVDLNDDVTHAGAAPVVLGERIEMRAEAKYYAGGGLPGADIHWRAVLTPTQFTPAGWDDFEFMPARPRSKRRYWRWARPEAIDVDQRGTLSGASAAGAVFGVVALPESWPSVLTVDATVTDVDRMHIRASSRPILVHPSAYYVGLHLSPDDDNRLDVVVTDIDGNPVAGVPVDIDIDSVLRSENDRDDAHVVEVQHCGVTSAAAPVACPFQRRDTAKIEYAYTATARVVDRRGRANVAQYEIPTRAWQRDQPLSVLPDRPQYVPGEVAKLAVVSDVVPATAIVSFARNGVIAQKRVELTAPSTIVELPIEPAFVSNVSVDIDRIAKRRVLRDGSKLPLPEHVETSIDLPVSIEGARLAVTTRPVDKIVEPGAPATFDVDVSHAGKPVANAEVALIVVDEAILALSNRRFGDPLPGFYHAVEDGTTALTSFDLVMDAGPDLAGDPGAKVFALEEHRILGGIGGGTGYGSLGGAAYGTVGMGAAAGIVRSRTDFRANAVFSPRLHTDAAGHASLTVTMPDSLTRFRIVALATANTYWFGKGEGTVITQRKVNARAVAPRFLTQGDQFSLPVVVQNLDSARRTVDVAVRAVNLASIGATGKRVSLDGGQRAEVRFDFRSQARGEAAIQTIATSGDFADASTVKVPVYAPATTEAFATYGVIDAAAKREQLAVPADIFPDVGGVEIEVASSQLQSLTDAFGYLYAYPYECAEQRSARMLATLAMADVLDAFATPGRPPRAELQAQLATDQRVLARNQLDDGGWGYWPETPSDPYVTAQVLRAIVGAGVVGNTRTNAIGYVARDADATLAALDKRRGLPPADRDHRDDDAWRARVAMTAADLTALAAAGVDVTARARHLHDVATALATYPVDAQARLLAVVARHPGDEAMRASLLAALLSATHETASAATVTASFVEAERMLLVSSAKTTALALDAIMRESPDQAVIPKLARGLLDARRRGRWISTQENLAVLTVMRRYFDTYENVTPDFTGRAWLGQLGYTEHAFAGHTLERATAAVGWPALPAGTTQDLAFAKDGPGRMYYRVGITYAPKRTDLPPLDAGFVVRRSYAAADHPDDVTRGADGRWHVKLGARVLVTVEALDTTPRYDVALVDPLPAGFEAINTHLAVAERAATGATTRGWDHVNMRDDRAEAFAHELREGSHVFAYSVRATTPGVFVAAPAKAEEMYEPETFGRSAGSVVVVEE